MEENTNPIESLFEKTQEYGRTSIELIKLKAVDKIADVASSFVSRIIVAISLIFFLLIFNIAVSLWLGDALGKNYYGFLVVAGFYALMGLILHYFMRGWIQKTISNSLITKLFN